MKAVYAKRYGSPSDLHIGEAPKLDLQDSRKNRANALVRVHAAGLHVGVCFTVRGKPFVVRMETGWLQPSTGIPGMTSRVWSKTSTFGRSADGS